VRWAILDTNVYVGHWQYDQFLDELETVRRTFIIRHSAVVLSELRRGARTHEARHLVAGIFRMASIQWAPTAEDWWKAGDLIRKIGDARGWDSGKRRDFQNDALIALTARRHGATVVTADGADFEILANELGISVLSL